MTIELWAVYALAALGLSLTPGPNGLLCLTRGARHGVGAALFTALGGVMGFMVLVAASLAGLGALLAASEAAFTTTKWIGGAYLVFLGVKMWRAPVSGAALLGDGDGAVPAKVGQLFAEGFLVAVSNPKALIFFAAFLPPFMTPGVPFWEQLVILGGTFAVIEFIYEMSLAGAARRMAPWLTRHERAVNRATGGMFIGIGGLLATSGR